MRYAVLGSGSSANAYIFEYAGTSVLIDNGFSVKELRRRAEIAGHDLTGVRAVFLTHMHNDHSRGIWAAARSFGAPLYLHHRLPTEAFLKQEKPRCVGVVPGCTYAVGPFEFTAFETSHDSPFSMSYALRAGDRHMLLITDTGVVTESMRQYASRADVLFLESNYDETMLRGGTYPAALKRRILSSEGHLSNDAAVGLLAELEEAETAPGQVYLCHLSAANNSSEAIRALLDERLTDPERVCVCEKGELYAGNC